jgi:Lrp/AsnC family leucine-responsive transcriptional regulator
LIDEMDRKMLRILQRDGRITNQDLASRCNISPSACLERFRRLRERGFIRGYAALLAPDMLDQALLVFVEIILERTTTDVFRKFGEAVAERPEILECHMVAGGFDYLVKLRVKDIAAYRRFLVDVLAQIPGVRETRTYVVMDEVKNSTELAI